VAGTGYILIDQLHIPNYTVSSVFALSVKRCSSLKKADNLFLRIIQAYRLKSRGDAATCYKGVLCV
jgi:hypothetical protein